MSYFFASLRTLRILRICGKDKLFELASTLRVVAAWAASSVAPFLSSRPSCLAALHARLPSR